MNLDILNDQQLQAVKHIDGPCLVLAGAGSGKTKVLTTRIANLIDNGIPSYHILAITFTNKAAKEMKDRLNKIVPNNDAFVGTFHSLGVRIIHENYKLLGLNSNFTIIDSDDILTLIKKIMKDLHLDPKDAAPSYIRNRISFIKNEMLNEKEIDALLNTPPEEIAKKVYYEYNNILRKNNSVDFDDLLLLPVKLFQEHHEVLERYQERYQYILIDEYQDTNEVQYKLSKLLASKYQNIFIVGDPDQSIYKFRGANFHNILNFERDYQNALIIPLEENYRSTKYILDTANSIIKHNTERKEKNLWSSKGDGIKVKYLRSYDDKHEITLILTEINKLLDEGYTYNDIALLYRTNAQSRLIEEMFIKASVPYKVVGSYYFYARKEIKDLLCYLKLLVNEDDDISLRRIINVPKRSIGEKTLNNLETKAKENNTSMFAAIDSGKELEFKNLILSLKKESESLSLTELIDLVLDKTGIKKMYEEDKSLDGELRIENLMEFKSITASYEERTGSVNLNDFLEEVSLIADISEHQIIDNAVTLMTMHSAKGLEFRAVFLVGMEEGLFPHQNSFFEEGGIEEERRLCYVGITRAKERLYITNAKRRLLYGREQVNVPSRFISEIDKDLLDVVGLKEEVKKINPHTMYTNDEKDYHSGDIINHTKYGKGVIISTEKEIITVAFNKNVGIKKLLKNHKDITKL